MEEKRECPVCKESGQKVEMVLEVDESKYTCPNCAFEIKNGKKLSLKKKNIYVGLLILFLGICIITFFFQQSSLILKMKNAYEIGNYEQAQEIIDKIYLKKELGDIPQKVEILSNASVWRRLALDEDRDSKDYSMMMTQAIAVCIGDYDEAKKLGIEDELKDIMNLTAQEFANEGFDVEYFLCEHRDDPKNQAMEPLRTQDLDRVNELIEQVVSEIDKNEVGNSINKRIQEREDEYNSEHPIQVSSDDCTITKENGYYYCNGTVSNISSSTYSYVKVKVTYYDENEEVLTTDWVYAVDSVGIKGGENQQFEIMSKVDGLVEYYKVEIVEWK